MIIDLSYIDNNLLKNINEKFFLYSNEIISDNYLEVLITILDEADSKTIYEIYSSVENLKIREAAFEIICKRNESDYYFLILEEMFNGALNFKFKALNFIINNNFFSIYPDLFEDILLYEKNFEIKKILNSFKTYEKEIDSEKAPVHNPETEEKSEQHNSFSISTSDPVKFSFEVKNKTFEGKKELVISTLEKTNEIFVLRNLIYSLNTEILNEKDKEKILNVLKQNNLIDDFRYDLQKISINSELYKTNEKQGIFSKTFGLISALIS
ncbi:MAG: hypothetical protein ACQESP_07625 [Candidatus Muiribacteriota bacterium]